MKRYWSFCLLNCRGYYFIQASYLLQVWDFVARYIPAYKTYLPNLVTEGPQRRQQSAQSGTASRKWKTVFDSSSSSTNASWGELLSKQLTKQDTVPVVKVRTPVRPAACLYYCQYFVLVQIVVDEHRKLRRVDLLID
jgi:hypothetical protein